MRPARALLSCALVLLGAAGTSSAAIGYAPDRAAAKAAVSQVGAPWAWGGASPTTGFDTSGLVVWAYAQQGIRLPHLAPALYTLRRAKHVSRTDLEPGDLVFFNEAGHVGIYIGNGKFVHAPHTGAPVAISKLTRRSYTGAIRIGPTS